VVLYIVLALVALLVANSAYLAGVTAMEWVSARWGNGETYQDYFYTWMILLHLLLGLLLIGPFLVFGLIHMLTSRNRKNKRAIRIGYALFLTGIAVLVTGVLLTRVSGYFELKDETARSAVYWVHVIAPLAAGWLYWLHRLAGPRIQWRVGGAYLGVVAVTVCGMLLLKSQDPRRWNEVGPASGAKYFEPSLARTASGNFIPAEALQNDAYCLKCHQDAYKGWFHSAHHFSSFNNPMYFASVAETRDYAQKRDGNVQASRWCAGCHDPVPFFSGAFDDPKFDMVSHPTAQAGITCTVCHSITHVNSTKGNADYTIEEPQHYPFTYSENALLQWVNNQLVKAKPSFHKKTMLKPLHKTAEFCSTCHKVHLPYELNHYKEFLRGQNHYDSYLLSGASGHGARSFYYPDTAFENCASCHMPLQPSNDFGARLFPGAKERSIHDHFFPGANTALPFLRNDPNSKLDDEELAALIKKHQDFMKTAARVDIFAVKKDGTIDGELLGPIRPTVPTLQPGRKYLLEAVIRTLKIGHHLTQGTVDSNELWLDVTVTSNGKVIGRSGGRDESGEVDPWSHFINVYMLDREGNRIDRRNPQDIFTPLYNHQVPPGAAQVAHYELQLPENVEGPVTISVKLQYRKFDKTYMDFVVKTLPPDGPPVLGRVPGQPWVNVLPITTMASDEVTFPVEGVAATVPEQVSPIKEDWQRWNDYGIGLFLEGQSPVTPTIGGKSELRQAEAAFLEVEKLGRFDGPVNLARVYFTEGRLDDATAALRRAAEFKNPAPPAWTVAWFSGLINKQQGHLDAAIADFKSVLNDRTEATVRRGFDFSRDYVVINELGQTLFERAKQERGRTAESKAAHDAFLREAVQMFEKTLTIDSEDVAAHHNLSLLHGVLGNEEKAAEHRKLHLRYKPDDNAEDRAVNIARKKNAAANAAAEKLVIYPLQRRGAYELPAEAAVASPSQTVTAQVEPPEREPVADGVVVGEPVAVEPVAGEPVAGEPVAGEPVAAEPAEQTPANAGGGQ
jgi:tetratricopeptide (TPR) repeat protein